MEKELQAVGERKKELTPELLAEAKRIEYPDNVIARLTKMEQSTVKSCAMTIISVLPIRW
mgnify:FL=1